MNGIERIRILASEVKDKALLKVVEYLLSRQDMNDKYLNEDKSLKQMINFIKDLARKQASGGVAMVEDEVVYSWAIHYWDETNENLKLEKATDDTRKDTEVEEVKEALSKPKSKAKKNWCAEGQLTLFDISDMQCTSK